MVSFLSSVAFLSSAVGGGFGAGGVAGAAGAGAGGGGGGAGGAGVAGAGKGAGGDAAVLDAVAAAGVPAAGGVDFGAVFGARLDGFGGGFDVDVGALGGASCAWLSEGASDARRGIAARATASTCCAFVINARLL
jgi:hypothetical protein